VITEERAQALEYRNVLLSAGDRVTAKATIPFRAFGRTETAADLPNLETFADPAPPPLLVNGTRESLRNRRQLSFVTLQPLQQS